ncbi:hypothetical protein EV401DRAFT_2211879 [Pisolithus croceorrhizus]|nr:hypothetical protein EV401DRAFT_2211879 [Pisolithus croceorrhizus]
MLPFRPIAPAADVVMDIYAASCNPPRAVQNVFAQTQAHTRTHSHPSLCRRPPSNPDDDDDDKDALPQPPPPKRRGRKPGTMSRAAREAQRKINHSLIEKARRTKINDALATLRQLVPADHKRAASFEDQDDSDEGDLDPTTTTATNQNDRNREAHLREKKSSSSKSSSVKALERDGCPHCQRPISGLIDDSPVKSTHMSVADEPRPSKPQNPTSQPSRLPSISTWLPTLAPSQSPSCDHSSADVGGISLPATTHLPTPPTSATFPPSSAISAGALPPALTLPSPGTFLPSTALGPGAAAASGANKPVTVGGNKKGSPGASPTYTPEDETAASSLLRMSTSSSPTISTSPPAVCPWASAVLFFFLPYWRYAIMAPSLSAFEPASVTATAADGLSQISSRLGGQTFGTWQHGRNAEPTVIRVPVGTVVKELGYDDPRRAPDEWEAEDEAFQELKDEDQRKAAWRERRWVHYPRWADENVERDAFKQAERAVWREERERRWMRRRRYLDPLWLDLSTAVESEADAAERDVNAPLGLGKKEFLGHLVARGGAGGLGNPNFVSQTSRSPKFATKGRKANVTLSLELKILADVGLVGMPNAGKSTLLRALTGGRAKTEVASYAFTTLNPVVGVIRVADDGTFEGELRGLKVFEETAIEEELELERQLVEHADHSNFVLDDGERSSSSDSELVIGDNNADQHPGYPFDILESFRFTISDNPGLIAGASSNVGLGHSFLRSLERFHAFGVCRGFSG